MAIPQTLFRAIGTRGLVFCFCPKPSVHFPLNFIGKNTVATTYQQAGVNIEEGDQFIRDIRKEVRSTYRTGVLGDIGAFGAFYDARFTSYKSPVLVSSVDGVGTKLIVAQKMGKHDTVGQDLVNHCVNDILVCGAQPLFFLDYLATGKLRRETAAEIIKGFARACRENRCSLVGGETAEMPGLYAGEDYDLAGMIVGIVEKREILDGRKVKKGNVLIGLPSTGLHTNGFSLARAVLLSRFRIDEQVDELGTTVGDALLKVHRSYLDIVSTVRKKFELRALSHITGGGIVGNTRRVLPPGRSLQIAWGNWDIPPIFQLIQRLGDVPEEDMRKTFNLGLGLIMIVRREDVDNVLRLLKNKGERGIIAGEVK
jgi:phosphoribosylformylglycinamidine cyclo-ligase